MTRAFLLAAVVAGFLPLAGCFQSAVDPLAPPDRAAQLVGTWESEHDGVIVTFGEDGRYLVQLPDGVAPIEGNYAVDGVGVVLVNDVKAAICPGTVGSYTFYARRVSGVSFLVKTLQGRFMLVKDTCGSRAGHMQQAYIKQ